MLLMGMHRTRSAALGILLACLTLLALPGRAPAVVREWTGLANQSWFNILNWSPTGTPAASDDLRINSGTARTSTTVYVSDGGWLRAANAGTGVTTGPLNVGQTGTGTLTVQAGALVSSTSGELGVNAGSTGTATVSGTDSKWTTILLYVGSGGSGTLSIETGGQVSNSYSVAVGASSSSTGAVTAKGANSKLTCTRSLTIGQYGSGSLSVEQGGQVSSETMDLGYYSGSAGTATVTGDGSTLTNSYVLHVGRRGEGTLTASAGGRINSEDAYLGYLAGSSGEATVTGPNSQWVNSDEMRIGEAGSGKLTVDGGGSVTTATLYASLSDLAGDGTITATKGAVLDANMSFDGAHGTQDTLAFGAGGILTLNIDGTALLGVGYKGAATLAITDGASIASSDGYVGYHSSSSGVAAVAGAGTRWTNSGDLRVGYYGNGLLNIRAGAEVSSERGILGYLYGSSGTCLVTGAESKWTNDNYLSVGSQGVGRLIIEAGGQVSNTDGYVGDTAGGTGRASLSGAGSSWSNTGNLYVGRNGHGSMAIEGGAQVSSSYGYVGWGADSLGDVVVSGAGSQWTNSDNLVVGSSGTAALAVADGGKVTGTRLDINNKSAVRLHVSNDDMLVLGNASTAGSISNGGSINFYADAFLAAGTHRPISESAGRTMTWSGTGAYNAVGGAWIDSSKTFVVDDAAELGAGASHVIGSAERMIVTDEDSGRRMGVSFGAVASGNFRAELMTDDALSALAALLSGCEGEVLSAWSIESDYVGGEVMLSFDVGLGQEDMCAWRLAGGTWTACDPALGIYDSNGIYSFTASGFSGYAVATPEPATLGLLIAGGLALLSRRRKIA